MKLTVNIFWFRRDLRLHDNAGLFHALKSEKPIVPIFIYDTDILDQLEDKKDKRVAFIDEALHAIQQDLLPLGASLQVHHGKPIDIFKKLVENFSISTVFTNHDYELYALERDEQIRQFLTTSGISFQTCKDHVIFEKDEVVKSNGQPYTVFTPYSKVWLKKMDDSYFSSYPTQKYFLNFFKHKPQPLPTLEAIGFEPVEGAFPPKKWKKEIISNYSETRDIPGIEGTSKIGVHLRFGTVSVRELARFAKEHNATYLNELIWREFYQMITWHFPRVGKGLAFKPAYDHIKWINNEEDFKRWCEGSTGYPIVDAGMRELNTTGFMHNRVRMVTASFLTKHLLIDWRWGEAYFAQKLLDFEFASNNGGWQWAAGSGCDAAPYFRIFNPYLQTKKFDPSLTYIKKWVPEFEEFTYPKPMVDHEFARKRALHVYGQTLKSTAL